jgi:hypothetical protein
VLITFKCCVRSTRSFSIGLEPPSMMIDPASGRTSSTAVTMNPSPGRSKPVTSRARFHDRAQDERDFDAGVNTVLTVVLRQ